MRMSKAFAESKLEVSIKTVAGASSLPLAKAVACRLAADGQAIDAVPVAEYLGINTSCGARRAVEALKKRLNRGLGRARRVGYLSREHPQAAKLYGTGVRPQQAYGASVRGAAPAEVKTMRRSAVLSLAPAGV